MGGVGGTSLPPHPRPWPRRPQAAFGRIGRKSSRYFLSAIGCFGAWSRRMHISPFWDQWVGIIRLLDFVKSLIRGSTPGGGRVTNNVYWEQRK